MTARAEPLCFDGAEEDLAADIVAMHDALVADRGFCPQMPDAQLDETVGRVASVVSASFGSFFDVSPRERYVDLFDQIACFADPADNTLYDWIQDIVTGGKSTSELAEVLRSHAMPTSRP